MLLMKEPLRQIADARSLGHMIVNTIREPLVVLDGDLQILFASESFHRSFQISAENTQNRQLFALDNDAWDIPALRSLL